MCPGTNSSISCSLLNNDSYIISGLTHSAAMEFTPNNTIPTCISSLTCDVWSACINGLQTRTCFDTCNQSIALITQTQSCVVPCSPNWICTNWTICGKSSTQARNCTDVNNCSLLVNMPNIVQQCEYKPSALDSRLVYFGILIIILVAIIIAIVFLVRSFSKKSFTELSLENR